MASTAGTVVLLLASCDSRETAKADAHKAACAAVPNYSGPDDVTGIRIGMGLAAVRTLLSCRDAGFRFTEPGGGFAGPILPDGTRGVSRLVARRGTIAGCDPNDPSTLAACVADDPTFSNVEEHIEIYTAGLPGQERVIAVMREESFPEHRQRASGVIERDMIAKYGAEPDRSQSGSGARYAWVFDGRGRRMSPQNPDFAACRDASGFGNDSPSRLRPGCRRTITAWIDAADNTNRADAYGVALVDPEAATRVIEQAKAQVGAAADLQHRRDEQRATIGTDKTAL